MSWVFGRVLFWFEKIKNEKSIKLIFKGNEWILTGKGNLLWTKQFLNFPYQTNMLYVPYLCQNVTFQFSEAQNITLKNWKVMFYNVWWRMIFFFFYFLLTFPGRRWHWREWWLHNAIQKQMERDMWQ